MTKWILPLAFCLLANGSFASTTKVGNGDDGGDLEGGAAIGSGIILETRREAVLALKALNIQGVPGLGALLPELEHGELIMAKRDVHPLASEGEWESSVDHRTVYARTFPEPHAPTRFFPAALKLSRDQLVALHTHEALHRALPPGVREDEDKVAYLTMAITSSSATFDRVSRIAATVLNQPRTAKAVASSTLEAPKPEQSLRPSTRTEFRYDHTSSAGSVINYGARHVEKFGLEFSALGVRKLWNTQYETLVSIAALLDSYAQRGAGPLSFTGKAPFYLSDTAIAGPYAQFNLKSLEPTYTGSDRDVYTVGAFFESENQRSYNKLLATYTLPSSFTPQKPDGTFKSELQKIPPVWSFWAREGFRLGNFALGGVFELHHAEGYDGTSTDTIIRIGPEVMWKSSRTMAGLGFAYQLNNSHASLDQFGDLAGHGSGQSSLSASLARNF